ncbi:MAG: hypothetical protein U0575_07005 [Phycisphaerales bacterium]
MIAALATGACVTMATQCLGAGSIVAWGRNDFGEGDVPAPNSGFVAVSAGVFHSVGLKSDGSIVAFGDNSFGQIDVPAPNMGFVAISAGYYHNLGLKSDGSVVAWGDDSHGQLSVPAPNTGFVAVSTGWGHSLGLKSDGSIVGWGWNAEGQLNIPAPNTGFVAVAGGSEHSIGLKSDGSIVAWGYNNHGQCNVPTPNTGFVAIASGASHGLGLKSDGSIVAWGLNTFGQCDVPPPNSGFVAVAAGDSHSFGLKSDGSIVVWGWNGFGQIDVPVPNAGFVAMAGGHYHSLGIMSPISCAELHTSELLCQSGNAYSWTFTFTNNSGTDASLLILPDPAMTPHVFFLNPPVTAGATSAPITVTVAGPAPGAELCFDFVLADIAGNECCHLQPCITLPECVCSQMSNVQVTATPTQGVFQMSFTFTNLSDTTSGHLVLASATGTLSPALVDIPPTPTYGTQSIGPITVTTTVPPGSDFCFVLGNHAPNWIECCFIEPCVTVPDAPPVLNPADLDGDGKVDAADLGLLLSNWGGSGAGDLDGDGVVGAADLGLLLSAWS